MLFPQPTPQGAPGRSEAQRPGPGCHEGSQRKKILPVPSRALLLPQPALSPGCLMVPLHSPQGPKPGGDNGHHCGHQVALFFLIVPCAEEGDPLPMPSLTPSAPPLCPAADSPSHQSSQSPRSSPACSPAHSQFTESQRAAPSHVPGWVEERAEDSSVEVTRLPRACHIPAQTVDICKNSQGWRPCCVWFCSPSSVHKHTHTHTRLFLVSLCF